MIPAVVVGGRRIENACRTTWIPGDDVRAKHMQVIGRAMVSFEDGSEIDAFLVASTESATLGDRFAMWFEGAPGERARLVLLAIPL